MGSSPVYAARVLQRKKSKDPYSNRAWENVDVKDMEAGKAKTLQEKLQRGSLQGHDRLNSIESHLVRRQVEALVQRCTDDEREKSSPYMWRLAFVEDHRGSTWIRRGLRDHQVKYTDTVDVILERIPVPVTPSLPTAYESDIYNPYQPEIRPAQPKSQKPPKDRSNPSSDRPNNSDPNQLAPQPSDQGELQKKVDRLEKQLQAQAEALKAKEAREAAQKAQDQADKIERLERENERLSRPRRRNSRDRYYDPYDDPYYDGYRPYGGGRR